MSDTTQPPADVRERVAFEAFAWEHGRRGAAAEWIRAQWQGEAPKWRVMYFDLADRILALLRTPRGEGEAMDADEMWNHWTSGHEDAALQGLRIATDDEAHRFLGMVADWQRCPKPSDHDARRGEAQGEESVLSAARLFVQQARAAGEDRFSDFGVFSAYEGLVKAVDAAHPTNRSESDE